MTIDPLKQQATVDSSGARKPRKKALYEYNATEVERQRKLYEGGVAQQAGLRSADQAFKNSKADWESALLRAIAARELDTTIDRTVRGSGWRYSGSHRRLRLAHDSLDQRL